MDKIKLNYKKNIFYLIIRNKYKYLIFLVYLFINIMIKKKNKKIGIVGLPHSQNIGNNLLKFAMYIKLSELGFDPYIIGKRQGNANISFILKRIKVRLIKKNFSEINENDYDILMVNSDQTWRKHKNKFFYNTAFLSFSKNWNKPKFVYGASIGVDFWPYTKQEDKIVKSLIKNFNGISVREKGTIKFIESHLGFRPILVLDPTLLIDKRNYLNLIKNFKIENITDNKFIFIYTLTHSRKLNIFIERIIQKFNYKIYLIDINTINAIQKFIYGIYKSKAVITDSYHGTIFSIIFNKAFISFVYKGRGKERFNNLKEIFNLENRIVYEDSSPDINLLEKPLNINRNALNSLKKKSIHFLKENLFFL